MVICQTVTLATVLSLICADALNATTGNSACKHCIHLSRFSFGTKSARKAVKQQHVTDETTLFRNQTHAPLVKNIS